MQSGGGDSLLHSCFDSLKTAVMGCCYSICHKEDDTQESGATERSRLLESVPVPESPPVAAPPPRPDEQTALSRILHETAANVIDVGALGPYLLEASAYKERSRAYCARVAVLSPPAAAAAALLRDVAATRRAQLLSGPPLALADRELISNAVKRAAAAISELRVEHHEELVVPFRVP